MRDPGEGDATETDVLEEVARADQSTLPRSFVLVREGASSRVVELADGARVVIGRAPEVEVHIDDSKASRRHAELVFSRGRLALTDLGSRNGTRLNGEVIVGLERPLAGGDLIQIGQVEIIVAAAGAVTPPASEETHAEGIVIADPAMAKVFTVARRLASVQTNVLILGETGAGKEVVAQQIHAWSARAAKPFVRLNCASLPDTLLESELFGYERGAFTGAEKRKLGYFEAANEGTFFLDEVGELSPVMQAKLLSVLENRAILRLGATKETAIDVRIICATHRDLEAEVKRGAFREDLYYRISTFTLKIPPLRERPREIALLAELFLRELGARMNVEAPLRLDAAAAAALEAHRWPGNVRELRNAIEHAVVLAEDGVIRREYLPDNVQRGGGARPPVQLEPEGAIKEQLEAIERKRIEEAIALENGNQTRAAQRLGMSRRTLVSKLARWRDKGGSV